MTTAPRNAPAKKAPARKATAAVAARREVRAEKTTVPPVEVKFRGQPFEIPRDRLGSQRFYMRQKFLQQFGETNEGVTALLFELLGRADSLRFIDLCEPGDTIGHVAGEFFAAVSKAQNVPNS